MRAGRVALGAAALGAAALLASGAILGQSVAEARAAGAVLSPSALVAGEQGAATPDETATYLRDPFGAELPLDVYLPPGSHSGSDGAAAVGAPVVVAIHGGGWIQGSQREGARDHRWLAEQGYVVVSPAYTLATEEHATWDIAMPEIGCALAWIAAHAEELGADPDRIAMWGSSAGGNLAIATGYAANAGTLAPRCDDPARPAANAGDPPGDDPVSIPPVRAVAGDVPAVDPAAAYDERDLLLGSTAARMVELYLGGTPADHPERAAATRVASYLGPASPPTLLVASVADHIVPIDSVRRFAEEARAAGVDVELRERAVGDHLVASPAGMPANLALRALLLAHFRGHGV